MILPYAANIPAYPDFFQPLFDPAILFTTADGR